jgi:quinol monooxygenase YgiN
MTERAGEALMELTIFGRFHAREGHEAAVAAAIREVVGPTRAEAGCLEIESYGSIQDPALFYIHSRWIDDAAFEAHALLPHTVRFLEKVEPLIDHPLDVAQARPVE